MVHLFILLGSMILNEFLYRSLSYPAIKQLRPTAKLLCSAVSRVSSAPNFSGLEDQVYDVYIWFLLISLYRHRLSRPSQAPVLKYSTFRVWSSTDSLHHGFGFDEASNFIIHCTLTSLEILHQEVTVGVQRSSCRCQRFHSSQDVLAVGFGISSFPLKKKNGPMGYR